MSLVLNVKWAEQSDQGGAAHQRIKRIGGSSGAFQWEYTQAQAVAAIELGQFYYFLEKDGRALQLQVGQTPGGEKYLSVCAQGREQPFLLDLPGFPIRPQTN